MPAGQGWKPDGFEKALLGEKAHEHTALFTRIEMDLLNSQVLRCARTLTISRAHRGPHCSFGSEIFIFGWNLAAGRVFCMLVHHLPARINANRKIW